MVIPQLPCLFHMAKLCHQWLYLSIENFSTQLILGTYLRALLTTNVSPLSYCHAQMDGKELDDTRYT
jgi:hypothetical protein